MEDVFFDALEASEKSFMSKRINTPEALAEIINADNTKVFDLLHTGVAIFSIQGLFLYSNEAFRDMFNLPRNILGKHISDYFLTGELGVMNTIRTVQPSFSLSTTNTNAQGISFRYPVKNANGELLGVIVESISPEIGKERMQKFYDALHDLEEKTNYLEQKTHKKTGKFHTFDSIIGESNAMYQLKRNGRRFARSNEPILLLGESGVGKELVAQALHSASPRAAMPFITVNCAALPSDLVEAELFGYESGAFTGAKSGGIKGKFELANQGTIFLDEIGELPLSMQAKLLRVLESGEIQKLGHKGQLHSDFRLIAATNRNLETCVENGKFREDLYHRLNILELVIPPLRDRLADIPALTRHFIETSVGTKRALEIKVSNDLYSAFAHYPWRGNIRELKNILTYALFSMDEREDILLPNHLPDRFFHEIRETEGLGSQDFASQLDAAMPAREPVQPQPEHGVKVSRLDDASAQAERKMLLAALGESRYNKCRAAEKLGISRTKLYRKLKEYNLVEETKKSW